MLRIISDNKKGEKVLPFHPEFWGILLFVVFTVYGDDAVIAFGFTESAGTKDEFVAGLDFRDIAVLEILSASDLNDFTAFIQKI